MRPPGLNEHEWEKVGLDDFRLVVQDHYNDLCLYAFRYLKDMDSSRDVVQEVITVCWRENHKLRRKEAIKGYLYAAVRNHSLNTIRDEKPTTELEQLLTSEYQNSLSVEPAVFGKLRFQNLQDELQRAVSELPEQRRRIFEMSRFGQMKHKEIADQLQISTKTVETQIYRSLIYLRKKLKHYL